MSWVRNPELEPDLLRVLEEDGRIVGYGDLVVGHDAVAVEVAAPGHWDAFLEWAEDTARVRGVSRVRVFFAAGYEPAAVLTARGYRLWRSAFTMEMHLSDEPPEVSSPSQGVELREYDERLAEPLRAAINEAFAEDPFFEEATPSGFREFHLGARGFDPSLWLLAWDGAELAGFALGFPQHAGDDALGWVQSLGVRPRWRRQGLGEALLRAMIARLHERGFRRVGLGVDAENVTGALRLYERVGMRVVRRGDNWIRDV